MTIDQKISGQASGEHSPSEQVLQDFYRAFNGKDMAAMSNNWMQVSEASMSNPLGGVKRGWDEIQQVYTKIFQDKVDVYVEFYDYSIHQSEGFFCAVGRERGYIRTASTSMDLAIRTTRVYQQYDGSWRQLHHHGSIDNPTMLAAYQNTVLGAFEDQTTEEVR